MKYPPIFLAIMLAVSSIYLHAEQPPVGSGVLPSKILPLPGEVFLVEGHIAFIIPAKAETAGKLKAWVWYAPSLTKLPGNKLWQ